MHFLSLMEWDQKKLLDVLGISGELKPEDNLNLIGGKTLLLLFEKPSTRTRISFEVAAGQLGGRSIYMDKSTSQMSRGESLKDTALVLGRYVDVVTARVFSHRTLEGLAR